MRKEGDASLDIVFVREEGNLMVATTLIHNVHFLSSALPLKNESDAGRSGIRILFS